MPSKDSLPSTMIMSSKESSLFPTTESPDERDEMIPQPSLLGIPLELRERIYAHVVRDIQSEEPNLEGTPRTRYEGLRLVCRQLHNEARDHVFFSTFTSSQLVNVLNIKPNMVNFLRVRSVSLEIPYDLEPAIYHELQFFLDCMQLSIQELRIFFIGKDRKGNQTGIHGCGKILPLTPTLNKTHRLSDVGKHIVHQWELIRHITLLRKLRILQIENANIPISPLILYNNKPLLQAVSVTSDPRSSPTSITKVLNQRMIHMYRNIPLQIVTHPPVAALSLDANSVTNYKDVVGTVSTHLTHFSWRVPDPTFQAPGETCFYEMTRDLLRPLSVYSNMETLRLCLAMPKQHQGKKTPYWDTDLITEELRFCLPRFNNLRELEIHFTGGDGFFRKDFIKHLPPTLSRLYLSDDMISPSELISQIRLQYFMYIEEVGSVHVEAFIPPTPVEHQPYASKANIVGDSETPKEVEDGLVGEDKNRRDDIPLHGGELGFVTYEFDFAETKELVEEDHYGKFIVCDEAEYVDILRLNGQLLDREHNLHLAATQSFDGPYGIKPAQSNEKGLKASVSEIQETATTSHHVSISANLGVLEKQALEDWAAKGDTQTELASCSKDYNWYFGNENAAVQTFEREPVAKVKGQKQKSTVAQFEVPKSVRCRWSCPDPCIPGVGSFPAPVAPRDWKYYV